MKLLSVYAESQHSRGERGQEHFLSGYQASAGAGGGRPGWAKALAGKERETGSYAPIAAAGDSPTPVVCAGGGRAETDEHSDHRPQQGGRGWGMNRPGPK